ncbi:glycosyltransferase [Micromonospora polyrhachis]|uniref:UDP:flavonoid glycosyltransferase YjiC (YdhE family) n=1 Tax=Micromonospora polyrhachis TaxID=1282883 RepID=A0A7W7SPW2_9ACTN|nr:glycosyltransferase [Micromonospora polyrhachis]MBB4958391.1 UDP:flavonoid glycosyltransferase YjiC (YdhE family) [Micromonospora polyrhachis]
MRILFTFAGGRGHFDPLAPIARAAEAAGHQVAVGCRSSMIPTIQADGFAVFSAQTDRDVPPKRLPLLELDPDREDRDLRDGFAGWMARTRTTGVRELCESWQPDLLVCDETDFGAMIAAERLGIPYASVLVLVAGSFARPELLADTLNQLRAEQGLPVDPELAMLSRHLVLSPGPVSFRDPAYPLPDTAHPLGPSPSRASDIDHPAIDWLASRTGNPTVYFTLGTIFNLESGDLFSRVLTGITELDVNLLVTVGAHIDPEEFGPQPPNVRVERFVPQAAVLPYCDLVVSHGGSGSVLGALAHGLPMVLLPMGADQPANAARCADLGIAEVLDAVRVTADGVREAVAAGLADPDRRRAAVRLRDEIATLPGPEYAVTLLERLHTTRGPVVAS